MACIKPNSRYLISIFLLASQTWPELKSHAHKKIHFNKELIFYHCIQLIIDLLITICFPLKYSHYHKAKTPKETEEDKVLAQLKKTQASISIWGLIMASQKHRDAILESMAGKEVPMDTTLEQVLSIMGMTTDESAIIFTTKDLPPEGGDHDRAFYVTIDCIGSKVSNVGKFVKSRK